MQYQNLTRMPAGHVVAVMVSWNGKDFLEKAIPSVLNELKTVKGDLLIVENGSTDNSFEFIQQKFPTVAVLKTNENLGGSGGFNAGITVALQSQCRYVWLLDNDIEAETGALSSLLEILENHSQAGAVGSQICLYQNPQIIQEIGAFITPWLGSTKLHHAGQQRLSLDSDPVQVDYLAACSLLVRSDVFHKIGLFHKFFIFYDDIEWGTRAKKNGWILLASPASVIIHHFGGIKPIIPWREYYRRRNKGFFLILHPPLKGRWLALLMHLISLNYWTLFYRFTNHHVLYKTFQMALTDLLNIHLGRGNLSTMDYPFKTGGFFPKIQFPPIVWLDIPEGYGDIFAAITAIQIHYSEITFYVKKTRRSKLLSTTKKLVLSDPPKDCYTAIVGEYFGLKAALMPSVYRFRQGQFQKIQQPIFFWLQTNFFRIVSFFIAVFRSLPQLIKLINSQKYLVSMTPYPNLFKTSSKFDQR